MTVRNFIHKFREADAPLKVALQRGIEELNQTVNDDKRSKPSHLPDQRAKITEAFAQEGPVWMLFFDAGRYDLFDRLVWDYFDGTLQRVWNGGIGYTGDWATRNLSFDFGNRGFFSSMPIRHQQNTEWDGREYFTVAPDIGKQSDVESRLAALGYTEGNPETYEYAPSEVNRLVKAHLREVNGGVIRYVKPHPPFKGLELTAGSGKTLDTRAAIESGDLSVDELTDAYIETYKVGLEAATELVPDLPGRVILTADHGTCLSCGQLFHGRKLDKHDHLTVVPWMEVSQTR